MPWHAPQTRGLPEAWYPPTMIAASMAPATIPAGRSFLGGSLMISFQLNTGLHETGDR